MADTNRPTGDLAELLLAVKEIRDAIRSATGHAEGDDPVDDSTYAVFRCEGCSRCFRCEGCSRCFRCEGCSRCFRCEGCSRCGR